MRLTALLSLLLAADGVPLTTVDLNQFERNGGQCFYRSPYSWAPPPAEPPKPHEHCWHVLGEVRHDCNQSEVCCFGGEQRDRRVRDCMPHGPRAPKPWPGDSMFYVPSIPGIR